MRAAATRMMAKSPALRATPSADVMIPDLESTFTKYLIRGVSVLVMDRPKSLSGSWIAHEIAADDYGLERINFHPGEVVIDLGAHVGMISIYLAKKYPFLSILAFEPDPVNFNNLLINLALNHVTNVIPRMIAITKDARPFSMISPLHNSGGASGFLDSSVTGLETIASSETLLSIFELNRVKTCKLLKIDCEGSEYEIFTDFSILNRVEWLSIEIHSSNNLRQRGYSPETLVSSILERVPSERLTQKINELIK